MWLAAFVRWSHGGVRGVSAIERAVYMVANVHVVAARVREAPLRR
eukprot:COSAG06_NODE_3051_length_5917_cov_20.478687_3_plen_45_part_00